MSQDIEIIPGTYLVLHLVTKDPSGAIAVVDTQRIAVHSGNITINEEVLEADNTPVGVSYYLDMKIQGEFISKQPNLPMLTIKEFEL